MYFEPPIYGDRVSDLKRLVTALVTATLDDASEDKIRLAARLRRVETAARKAGCDPQTLQVITSGRRLLGDRADLTPETLRRQSMHHWLTRQRPALRP